MISVRYKDGYDGASLEPGNVYDVLEIAEPFEKIVFYRLKDELGDIAYYPWNWFDVVSGETEAAKYGVV